MFNISARDRYLYAGPVGLETTAMTYGRMQYRPDPPKLSAHRHAVSPWSGAAMMPAESAPLVRELTRKPSKPARYSDTVAAMLRARDARRSA